MKVALVHDQLREFGGAERVLVVLKKLFPDAPVYTSTADLNTLRSFADEGKDWDIRLSWFGKLPFLNRYYSPFRFLTPTIWERFDFSDYDLVISSSGSWMCKGIKTKPPTVHISYIHHPPRYLYGYETAVEWQKYFLIKVYGNIVNHFLRIWDYESTQRPDYLIANSKETQRRIQKFYHRDATVIYPPVTIPKNIPKFRYSTKDISYITVSRLARAKHVDLLIRAANKHKFNLKIVGTGRDIERLKKLAGPTIEFLGNVDDKSLPKHLQKARAFLFASVDEEFGIAPVEAMGYGLPVIAYRSGGLPETVENGVNGYLYDELSPDSLITQVKYLESLPKEKYLEIRKQARSTSEKFSEEKFRHSIMNLITLKIKK